MTAEVLSALDLSVSPGFDPGFFPHGVNIEIVTPIHDGGGVHMRVHERGVGETRSCGTGTVAAAAAALRYDGRDEGSVLVRVLGGEVQVTVEGGKGSLRGPRFWWRTGRSAMPGGNRSCDIAAGNTPAGNTDAPWPGFVGPWILYDEHT